MQKFLNTNQAAEFLGISEEELLQFHSEGLIRMYCFTKLVKRFKISELQDLDIEKIRLHQESVEEEVDIPEEPNKPEVIGAIYFIGPSEKIFKRSVVTKTSYNAVKIGFTTNLKRRLQKLQTGSPLSLHLMALIEDKPMLVERNIHRMFYKRRMEGEWFYYDDQMDDSLYRYINQHYVGGKREYKRVMKKYS